ncbi:GNAT family N-acetyltransferase [Aestuariibius sp. HNIBRBA575]|uniref:GNAT family N-acetyltransferase n=1 Tax=Aestuariibius sp. HNIBRBA575 TaxID=3233343 RepID=UPI0034A3A660
MTQSFSIRIADTDDSERILDLLAHLTLDDTRCPPDVAHKNLTKLMAFDGSCVFIGEVAGIVAATCMLIIIPNLTRSGAPFAVIENVVTHPDHRGAGYGTQILDAACARAWQHDCYKIMLSTGSKNPTTYAFYEQAGFEQSRTGFQKRRIAPRAD